MKKSVLLAWRYLCYHRMKSVIMLLAMTVMLALPLTVHTLVRGLENNLMARANATPLVVGARGSRFDLTLHALYFKNKVPGEMSMRTAQTINESGLALAIPLHRRFTAQGWPVVGTLLEYFDFRRLTVDSGRGLVRLGDCLLGSRVAHELKLAPDDYLISDPENVFDIAGSYPLNMRVTGVLSATGTADDDAVFTGIKTAWLIEGRAHGHQDTALTNSSDILLEQTAGKVVYNAALPQYTQVTENNIGSFHFHGDPLDFPVTAILAVPNSKKSETLLRGRYQNHKALQILVPSQIVEELVGVVFKIKRFLDANLVVVGMAVGLLFSLVVLLSLRLRQREMEIMFMLGCARGMTIRLQVAEIGMVLLVGAALAFLIAGLAACVAPALLGM